jgi:acetyl-CoA carboxylase biotin carboxyl carrier protein
MDTIDNLDIDHLISLFDASTLSEFELTSSRYTIKLKREVHGEGRTVAPIAAPQTTKRVEPPKQEGPATEVITSPIVGTFYLTPAPDAPPYVTVGTKVHENGVLCTIEAMKLMNQLEAEYACEVVEILAKPEQMVEFGQPLFKVKRI